MGLCGLVGRAVVPSFGGIHVLEFQDDDTVHVGTLQCYGFTVVGERRGRLRAASLASHRRVGAELTLVDDAVSNQNYVRRHYVFLFFGFDLGHVAKGNAASAPFATISVGLMLDHYTARNRRIAGRQGHKDHAPTGRGLVSKCVRSHDA